MRKAVALPARHCWSISSFAFGLGAALMIAFTSSASRYSGMRFSRLGAAPSCVLGNALWICAGGRRLEWSSIKPFSRLSTNCRAPELGTSWHLKPVAFFWCRPNCTAGTCRSHSRQVVPDTTYTARVFALGCHMRNRPPSTD